MEDSGDELALNLLQPARNKIEPTAGDGHVQRVAKQLFPCHPHI